jgi:hypothetical protein
MAAVMGLMGLLTACGAGVGQGQQNIDSSKPASSAAVDPAQSSPSSQPATPASAAAAEPVQNSGTPHDAVSTSALGYALKMTDEDLGSASQWKSSYVIEATPTVFIALEVDRGVSGYHTASIVVHTPQGLPYQHFDFTFTTAAPAGAEAPAIKGVLRAERTPTGYRLWVAMPVANTLIQDLGLAGGWSSSVYVDRPIRPTASTSFTLVHAQE